MAFGSKVDNSVRLVVTEEPLNQFGIANVSLHKEVAGIRGKTGEIFQIAGIGEFVQVDDAEAALSGLKDKAGADEAGPASDKKALWFGHGKRSCRDCRGAVCEGRAGKGQRVHAL